VASNPSHPEAWLTLGQVYEASGMLAPAIQAYQRQLEILPGDVDRAVGGLLLFEDQPQAGRLP
jgi:cytochrome c-type biogenesis protein CcmH/NrfG